MGKWKVQGESLEARRTMYVIISLLCTLLLPTLVANNIIPFVSVVRPHLLEQMFRHCTTTIFIGPFLGHYAALCPVNNLLYRAVNFYF